YQTQDLLAALAADGVAPPPVLRVDGGMVANRWLLQALADLTGLPVERPVYGETTVVGAALLAGLGCGVFPSLAAAESAWRFDFRATPALASDVRNVRLKGWGDAVERVKTISAAAQ